MTTISDGVREKAVAASEAVYRVSNVSVFDAVLKFELRKRSIEILTGVAGITLASGEGVSESLERVRGLIAGVAELIRFGRDMHFIAPENADRILAAYASIQDSLGNAEDLDSEPDPDVHARSHRLMQVNRRKEKILEYVGSRGQAQIGHLRGLLPDSVSEKTLQRDLSELVGSGMLRRQGDNRWTTYMSI